MNLDNRTLLRINFFFNTFLNLKNIYFTFLAKGNCIVHATYLTKFDLAQRTIPNRYFSKTIFV